MNFSSIASAIVLASLMASATCRGALTVVEDADGQRGLFVFKMTVDPAKEPVPALQHRLMLRERELRPGNAATLYLRAYPEGGIERTWKSVRTKFGDVEVDRWYVTETPLDKLPLEKVREATDRFHTLLNEHLRPASERLECDWGHRIITERRGPDVYSFMLPELQSMREISRAITLRTRVAIADRKYDEAIDLLRMNYRLGENVAQSPLLVSGLIGLAICGAGNLELAELIAAPGSPNLYWAVAELPRPIVDIRTAMRLELSMYADVMPVLDRPEKARHSPEEWAALLASSTEALQTLGSGTPKLDPTQARLAVTGFSILGYGDAKRRLIEGGFPADEVEAMPVGQVIAVDADRQYRVYANEFEKWQYVPYPMAKSHGEKLDALLARNALESGAGGMLARLLLPALTSVRSAQLRVERQLNAIQVVEAIRMHAAETGRLPETLDQITAVPVPLNPMTDRPFDYRLEGKMAVLELPFSDGAVNNAWRFEIQLAAAP